MAAAHMSDEFFDLVARHLPPEQPAGPQGGRPRVRHRLVVRVLWFVLATGCRWEDVPPELGCSGRAAHRPLLAWEELGVWDRLHADPLRLLRQQDKLDPGTVIVDSVIARAFGGQEGTGPSRWTAGKWARNTPSWSIGTGSRWPSGRPGRTPATTG